MAAGEHERVCLGVIGAPHGVRGDVRIRTFTEIPEDIAAYGELTDDAGRLWRLSLRGRHKNGVLASLRGIGDRNAAERLRGQRLYVARARLPELEAETYYHTDLIGLEARTEDGRVIGDIAMVQDFGAGPLLEITNAQGGTLLLPFTAARVPVVDIAGGKVVLAPCAELDSGARNNGETGIR